MRRGSRLSEPGDPPDDLPTQEDLAQEWAAARKESLRFMLDRSRTLALALGPVDMPLGEVRKLLLRAFGEVWEEAQRADDYHRTIGLNVAKELREREELRGG